MTSASLREIVRMARANQKIRFEKNHIHCNAEMSNIDIQKLAQISQEALKIAIGSTEKLKLSTRVYYRILRVARTIADIDTSPNVDVRHILEALSYRGI